MYVLVLPVSGGGFVTQLAILQHLCEASFVPDLVLASSGGNVAAYIGAASNWKWAPIQRIAGELSQSIFLKPWNSVSALSMIIGFFKGNIYDTGSGVKDFMYRYFTPRTITKYEIWTGTYNKNRRQARLFCNRSESQSILKMVNREHNLTRSMPPIFMNGNFDLIGQVSLASASIPAVVPPQHIFDEDYIDGGIGSASPLTIMQEPILNHCHEHNLPLHVVYVNSVDLSDSKTDPTHNILETGQQAAKDLIRSQTVIDRLAGFDLLRCHPGTLKFDEFPCTAKSLTYVKQIWDKVKYSMLEIYPISDHDIELTKFDGQDIVNGILAAYTDCKCRLWWISPSEADDPEICHILAECTSG